MNSTLLQIIQSREDISEYLFHFTKGSKAWESLYRIVEYERIVDINNRGYICFTEVPVTLLVDMFKIFERYKEPMYAPYGIAVKKDWLFAQGARPAIYGLPKERNDLPDSFQWRFVDYIPKVNDFSWLREWRIQSHEVKLTYDHCFIITQTSAECKALAFNEDGDINMDGDIEDGQFHGYAVGNFSRSYKGISLEEIAELNNLSKNELEKLIKMQNTKDNVTRTLGSF